MSEGRKKSKRGFAAMPELKRRNIASLGGKAVHEQGVGHKWTLEEAREAGRQGGLESWRRRRAAKAAAAAAEVTTVDNVASDPNIPTDAI